MPRNSVDGPASGVDQLASAVERLSRDSDDPEVQGVVAQWSAPLSAAVSGRPGVGKSTLIDALGKPEVLEIRGVDAPDLPHPTLEHDILFHVVARTLAPVDRDVLAARVRRETLVVAGRLDLVDPRLFVESLVVESLTVGVPVVRADDLPSLVAWWDAAVIRARRRRDLRLLASLERVAARRVDTRLVVESFLGRAGAVRRGA